MPKYRLHFRSRLMSFLSTFEYWVQDTKHFVPRYVTLSLISENHAKNSQMSNQFTHEIYSYIFIVLLYLSTMP